MQVKGLECAIFNTYHKQHNATYIMSVHSYEEKKNDVQTPKYRLSNSSTQKAYGIPWPHS
jgi:hypothetical protein